MTAISLLIKGARVIDPASGLDQVAYVSVRDGRIDGVGARKPAGAHDEVLDADGLWLLPGIVDLAVRLREPGQSYKATIRGEAVAARAGGITSVCLPPDTQPVIDTPAVVDWLRGRVAECGGLHVYPLGALTRGLAGEALAEMAALAAAGCVGISQGLAPLHDTLLMRRALEYAATCGLTVHVIALDAQLAGRGCAHEGAVATRLGLPAIPVAAETAALAQWLALVEQTGARVHFGRLTSARGVAMLADAAAAGLPVSADVAVHHLYLADTDLNDFDARCHVQPPLRAAADRDALRAAVASGTVTAVCSDHQPHEADAKINPFPLTEPGISGLETLLPLTLQLVTDGVLPLADAVARLTAGPAAVLGLEAGRITPGAVADLVLLDPDETWTLHAADMLSAGRNSPFEEWSLRGRVQRTVHCGRTVYSR